MKSSAIAASRSVSEMRQQGQSPWLDYISREILSNGKLKSLIEEQGLLGVTSNPSIFQKAISDPKGGYEKDIQRLVREGASTFDIYDNLTIADIQETCDLFRPVFDESNGEHGFVSLEVLPGLAHEEEETVHEARRLFKAVNRPNVMIKVPSTPEGIPAVRRLIGEGINVNITLMFSLKHYQDVAEAYIAGLEDLKKKGGDLSKVHSVASVFVSRIDTLLDKRLETLAEAEPSKKAEAEALLGKTANSNSKIIYQEFKKLFGSERFEKLQASGANVQKVLWGSTSTKNPNYPELLYVEPLIGRETVNTLPMPTLEAFIDHGQVKGATIEEGVEEARAILKRVEALGFDLHEICEQLQKDGVKSFCDAFDQLMATIESFQQKKNQKKNE